jgi:hypothetical protein
MMLIGQGLRVMGTFQTWEDVYIEGDPEANELRLFSRQRKEKQNTVRKQVSSLFCKTLTTQQQIRRGI